MNPVRFQKMSIVGRVLERVIYFQSYRDSRKLSGV